MSYGRRLTLTCVVFATLLAAGCSQEQPAQPPAGTAEAKPAQWQGFVNRFIEDSFKANPFQAVDAGRHEYDGKVPDWSTQGIADEIARLKAARAEAEAFPADRSPRAALRAGLPHRRRDQPKACSGWTPHGFRSRTRRTTSTGSTPTRTSAASTRRSRSAWPDTSATPATSPSSRPIFARTCRRRCRRASWSAALPASAATRSSTRATFPRSSRACRTRTCRSSWPKPRMRPSPR